MHPGKLLEARRGRHARPVRAAAVVALALVFALTGCGGSAPAPAPAPAAPPAPPPVNSLDAALVSFETGDAALDACRALPDYEDTVQLDRALRTVFGTTRPPLEEATVLALLRYVPQVTRLEFLGSRAGSDCLKEGKGFCTDMAQAFVALCRRAGLPARVNSFHNFGLMQGHNAAEVHYDGGWHFLDPTYGTFFYSNAAYGGGRILTLHELSTDAEARAHCLRVTDKLWTGNYRKSGEIEPAPADYLREAYGYSLHEFYETLFTRAFPIVPSDRTAASFPITLELDAAGEAWAGAIDDKADDLFGKRGPDGRWPRYYGFSHLGKTRHATAFHTLTLRVPAAGLYRLTYHFSGGDQFDLAAVELRNVAAGTPEGDTTQWSVDLYVQDTEALLLIVNRRGQAYIDAIHVTRAAS